ncbi:MAG TPA: DUF1294 domain-containing protein [Sedimentisphaerales bacterium]|jgi:uncharacterized membrane protein YsdA (DUF1294 family)|nr:DUF1294 domain-containing protein [Sedimentisphaerales bacterium]HNU29607.1 DUF1294 domain-containing protein [Sedimentisphaerales bacterium]
MKRHKFIKRVVAIVLLAGIALGLLLWRLGLAPLYAGLASINAITLLLYGYDKRQAVADGTRIPEVVLHLVALLGGSPAAIVAQELFRHKTRKLAFRLVLVPIILLQAAMVYACWRFLRG